jgi:hypothetical protein
VGGSSNLRRPFLVSQDGVLWASGAHIKGHIVATSGEIGGCSIVGGKLEVTKANIKGQLDAD